MENFTLKRLLIITGTPGTGKSTVAKLVCNELDLEHIDFHKIIEKDSILSANFNKEKDCYDLDMDRVEELLKLKLEENPCKIMVFDTHVAQHLPKEMILAAIVMRCSDLKILEKRLLDRDYSVSKVKENLDSEIFDVCCDEAMELGVETFTFDSAQKIDENEIITKLTEFFASNNLF